VFAPLLAAIGASSPPVLGSSGGSEPGGRPFPHPPSRIWPEDRTLQRAVVQRSKLHRMLVQDFPPAEVLDLVAAGREQSDIFGFMPFRDRSSCRVVFLAPAARFVRLVVGTATSLEREPV